jgi:V/A-type H+-transporting ATPase subunit D
MAVKFVPPTRSNYLKLQRSLRRAQQGYELLERKRQILALELMSKVEQARAVQKDVEEAMARAHEAFRAAAQASGVERLARESCAVPAAYRLDIGSRSVVGVAVPRVSFERARQALPFGLLGGAEGADETFVRFSEALAHVMRLAEVENAVLRLAREVKRTQRRVNALEKNFIPAYEDTLKYIRDCLDEREREDLVIMKKVKRMRTSAGGSAAGRSGAEGSHA